ncbi:hypoxanthine phosphoribosyltransferase [Calderihabitans maritimus]|uniref:Hypoxanthine phosphoribosyltransferase n=1 Tax=Calderihabitans maritimus TaxID=1246530 RepID=A0A1Z5HS38_9FIRM|nr:hypoxanthine phosphoribosyltransferase [Calderihabitans maritimus]GAW92177.1 hypoxanthine phosphoribosyltransferase [Calderihabitans maritimus]
MERDVQEILLDRVQIAAKVKELGKKISEDYRGKDLLVVGILKGAIMFMADLVREIDIPITVDFMAVSSYGQSTESSGAVRILKDLEVSVEGKNVLIVEDIVDTGLTLRYLLENLKSRHPASVRVCTLLDKPSRRQVEVSPDYNGFEIPDKFVVGYGLDYAEQYRHLPYIAVLKPEAYGREE